MLFEYLVLGCCLWVSHANTYNLCTQTQWYVVKTPLIHTKIIKRQQRQQHYGKNNKFVIFSLRLYGQHIIGVLTVLLHQVHHYSGWSCGIHIFCHYLTCCVCTYGMGIQKWWSGKCFKCPHFVVVSVWSHTKMKIMIN